MSLADRLFEGVPLRTVRDPDAEQQFLSFFVCNNTCGRSGSVDAQNTDIRTAILHAGFAMHVYCTCCSDSK